MQTKVSDSSEPSRSYGRGKVRDVAMETATTSEAVGRSGRADGSGYVYKMPDSGFFKGFSVLQ